MKIGVYRHTDNKVPMTDVMTEYRADHINADPALRKKVFFETTLRVAEIEGAVDGKQGKRLKDVFPFHPIFSPKKRITRAEARGMTSSYAKGLQPLGIELDEEKFIQDNNAMRRK